GTATNQAAATPTARGIRIMGAFLVDAGWRQIWLPLLKVRCMEVAIFCTLLDVNKVVTETKPPLLWAGSFRPARGRCGPHVSAPSQARKSPAFIVAIQLRYAWRCA